MLSHSVRRLFLLLEIEVPKFILFVIEKQISEADSNWSLNESFIIFCYQEKKIWKYCHAKQKGAFENSLFYVLFNRDII